MKTFPTQPRSGAARSGRCAHHHRDRPRGRGEQRPAAADPCLPDRAEAQAALATVPPRITGLGRAEADGGARAVSFAPGVTERRRSSCSPMNRKKLPSQSPLQIRKLGKSLGRNDYFGEQNETMSPAMPEWLFTCGANATWAWLELRKDGTLGISADVFISLDEATANAVEHGFDPFIHYWIAQIDGRMTHYRPRKATVNLTANETPSG